MSRIMRLSIGLMATGLAIAVSACGGGSGSAGSASLGVPNKQDTSGKQGGTLTVLASGDVDYIDPGAAYYQFSYMIDYATQRPLYSWAPDETQTPTPDLAVAQPKVSNSGKTITVEIRPNILYSPPLQKQAVTSADVKYGIERGFMPSVANGYATAYLGNIVGAAEFSEGKATEISGISTPTPTTIVFNLTKPTTAAVIGALALPLSAPVPESYAAKYDAGKTSTYGTHQVSTGPYMIRNNAAGETVGYQVGKSIDLVRNPNWDAKTDYRKAYLNEIKVTEGNADSAVASRQILQGQSQINGDFGPPPAQLQQLFQKKSSQLVLAPSGGIRYVALNTTVAPLDNLNVRKAIVAVSDREAMRKARGGEALGPIATHFIPPEMPGFDQAGGEKGPDYDFLANPTGNLALAQSYMKKAGYPSGSYTGSQVLQIVGTSGGQAQKLAEITQAQLAKLGFKTKLQLVTQDAMYTQFCNVPKKAVAVCPNVGWLKDFNDAQTILVPTFNGENIVQVNNSNWPQLNVPSINEAMNSAQLITDPNKAADAWAAIDKQVTAQAPAIPWIWDQQPNIASQNVQGVISKFNAQWDLSFTSIK